MRGKAAFWLTASILSAAVICLSMGVLAAQQPQLFTRSNPSDKSDPTTKDNNGLMTEKQVRDAVQRWHNDRDNPLNITKVKIDQQSAPENFLIWLGDAWKTAHIDIETHPGISKTPTAIPVVYRIGPVNRDLLFIIDRGNVVQGPFQYKRPLR